MSIQEEATNKAKKMFNLFLFFPIILILGIMLSIANGGISFKGIFLMSGYCLIVLWLPYVFIRSMMIKPFIKYYEKKLTKEYYRQQEINENYQYNKALNRDLERKRRELEIELNHLKQIALLNSATDERKMRLIYQMERELQNRQNNDLDSLNAQIERMKREL